MGKAVQDRGAHQKGVAKQAQLPKQAPLPDQLIVQLLTDAVHLGQSRAMHSCRNNRLSYNAPMPGWAVRRTP